MNVGRNRQRDRTLLAMLGLKLLLLLGLYALCFSPAHRPRQDTAATVNAVLGRPSGGASLR